jgi:hypothetical protein
MYAGSRGCDVSESLIVFWWTLSLMAAGMMSTLPGLALLFVF